MDYSDFLDKDIIFKNIDCNNNPLNVVPKYCSCEIAVKNNINIKNVDNLIKAFAIEYNFNIETTILDNNNLKMISHGVQAHAAHPDLGVNAISRLIIVLDKLFKNYNIIIPIFDLFTK